MSNKNNLSFWTVTVCFMLFTACQTLNPTGARSNEQDHHVFELVLESDPPGATVSQTIHGKTTELGRTPYRFRVRFDWRTDETFLGQLGLRSWVPRQNQATPWRVIKSEKDFIMDLGKITLTLEGYQNELFETRWVIPGDLNLRNSTGMVLGTVPTERGELVYFRNPTRPEIIRTLTVDSIPAGAQLTSLPERGGESLTLPFSERLGFARNRDMNGNILSWRWWGQNQHRLFEFDTETGILGITGNVDLDGYETDRLNNRPVFQPAMQQEDTHKIMLRLTTPANPTAEFQLTVDSLPSGGDVFLLLTDGTLGQRLGKTPFTLPIGLAQKLTLHESGQYMHDDWLVWAPGDLIHWDQNPDGRTVFYLACGIYHEGFATEKVFQPIFELVPGQPLPKERTLTIPLLHPQQAAARENSRANDQQRSVSPAPRAQPGTAPKNPPAEQPFVWRAPEHPQPVRQEEYDPETENPSWFRKRLRRQ